MFFGPLFLRSQLAWALALEWTNGSKVGLSHLGTIFSFFQFLLSLSIFGQVESSNFLCFLNLLLVCLYLHLQFLSKFRHCILVLLVLILLELELLDAAFRFLEQLICIRGLTLDTS